jgi:hypothetical protein
MNSKLPWAIVVVLGGLCAFLSLGEVKTVVRDVPRVGPKEVVREVPKEVIKEVVREVPKEVIKEVPAAIPNEYLVGKRFYDSYLESDFFTSREALKGTGPFRVVVALPDDSQLLGVTKEELKNSIELALRKNGLPVKGSGTAQTILFVVDGLWNDDKVTYSYSAEIRVLERVPIYRESGFKDLMLPIWMSSYTGYAGKKKTSEGIRDAADKLVIAISNEYLEANTK